MVRVQFLCVRKATQVTRSGDPLSEPAAASAVSRQYVWDLRYVDAPVVRWYVGFPTNGGRADGVRSGRIDDDRGHLTGKNRTTRGISGST